MRNVPEKTAEPNVEDVENSPSTNNLTVVSVPSKLHVYATRCHPGSYVPDVSTLIPKPAESHSKILNFLAGVKRRQIHIEFNENAVSPHEKQYVYCSFCVMQTVSAIVKFYGFPENVTGVFRYAVCTELTTIPFSKVHLLFVKSPVFSNQLFSGFI